MYNQNQHFFEQRVTIILPIVLQTTDCSANLLCFFRVAYGCNDTSSEKSLLCNSENAFSDFRWFHIVRHAPCCFHCLFFSISFMPKMFIFTLLTLVGICTRFSATGLSCVYVGPALQPPHQRPKENNGNFVFTSVRDNLVPGLPITFIHIKTHFHYA